MPSANSSFLTKPNYGYDIVVATTQASINATMKKYLQDLGASGKVVHIVAVKDPDGGVGATKLMDYDKFIKLSNGSDPFSIPSGTKKEASTDLTNVANAKFRAGIKVTFGLPKNFDLKRLSSLPNIINLKDGVGSIKYTMLCADIQIAQLVFDDGESAWKLMAQSDVPNRAWTCTASVNLKLDTEEFANLPKDVQDKVKNLDDNMFSVQQLLLDVDTASLSDVPKVDDLPPESEAARLLSMYFCSKYFGAQKEAGRPVLGYTVVRKDQTATLKPTNLNFHVSPLKATGADANLKTLDYLCSTGTHNLPPGTDFDWDWVSADDAKQTHGVIAISRNTFRDYLYNKVYSHAMSQVFKPWVNCKLTGTFKDVCNYTCGADHSKTDASKMKTEWIDSNDPSVLFKLSYSDEDFDRAGNNGDRGSIQMKNEYHCTIKVKDNKIYADSVFKVYLFTRFLQSRADGDVYKKVCKDSFELIVDGSGNFKIQPHLDQKDDPWTNKASGFTNFFADVNSLFDKLSDIKSTGASFDGAAVATLENFVFPGASTFAFKGFRFSEHQDLLCDITYADPELM
ncbi:hypothetical protein FKW77_007160 [Venturia effusa]|uniref:Uncharacterized protein n=1 Tax=Venturia effusa TaxID=50376 RepID=A0A517KZN1_9PEZI|nr:hypothetical protein FKW77_007160 [Venturia effusa]